MLKVGFSDSRRWLVRPGHLSPSPKDRILVHSCGTLLLAGLGSQDGTRVRAGVPPARTRQFLLPGRSEAALARPPLTGALFLHICVVSHSTNCEDADAAPKSATATMDSRMQLCLPPGQDQPGEIPAA